MSEDILMEAIEAARQHLLYDTGQQAISNALSALEDGARAHYAHLIDQRNQLAKD